MTKRRLFLLHNPKAGGSALRSLFARFYCEQEVAPVFSNAPNDDRKNNRAIEQYRGYRFYAGHYGYDAFRRLAEGHSLITNFRDPIERILSLYRFWRNNVSTLELTNIDPRDATVVLLSHELDFSDFIRSSNRDLLLYISNFHFRQLRGSPREFQAVRPWDRYRVKHRISRMPWFYIAETPNASAALLSQAFPELSSAEIPITNPSSGEQINITAADARLLVELNRLDYDIYQHAIREQITRLTSIR